MGGNQHLYRLEWNAYPYFPDVSLWRGSGRRRLGGEPAFGVRRSSRVLVSGAKSVRPDRARNCPGCKRRRPQALYVHRCEGNFTGFDVELFTDVADRAGIDNVVFTGQDFSGLLPAVANGQFDVGVAAIGITDERKQTVDFSDGYLAGYLTVITTKASGITDVDGLDGKRLGVVQGTLQEAYAVKNFTAASWCASRTTTPPSLR